MRKLCLPLLLAWTCVAAQANPGPDDPLGDWLAQRASRAHADDMRPHANMPASQLVVHAMGFLGVPYRMGGSSFDSGFDCSGFVQALYAQGWGVSLPRRAVEQAHATREIREDELQPGDLVFFNTLGPTYSHVGLYVGDGRFIHSPRAGASIRMESMQSRYWRTRFEGARRVDRFSTVGSAP